MHQQELAQTETQNYHLEFEELLQNQINVPNVLANIGMSKSMPAIHYYTFEGPRRLTLSQA